MTRRSILWLVLGALLFAAGTSVSVYFIDRMATHSGPLAVDAMNAEELAALRRLESLHRNMSAAQVHRILGEPSEDILILAKWNGFGGSMLSQLRVFYLNGRPAKIRWIKIGYFVYERTF